MPFAPDRVRPRLTVAALALSLAAPVRSPAQQPAQQPALTGYSAVSAAWERRVEAAAIRGPEPVRAAAYSRELSREPHVAGSPAQERTRDYVLAQMRAWGLATEVRAYDVWMPHATGARLRRVAPDTLELPLAEGTVAGDASSDLPQYPTVSGYSAAGDVTGQVIYVNYGLIEDYARLDSMGVSVKGRVAVARYGQSFRGIKAREAERHGAAALLIYSDPQDDGYAKGDVYPDGPMRPERGVQRGTVFNGDGDPSTPGWPSTAGARRLAPAQMDVPHIPVLPLSYRNATELLRGLRGADIPQAWQGGLPFRYHVGPGPVAARVVVTIDTPAAAIKRVWNVFGVLRGSEFPTELVILGAHRDAWGPGAWDNVSGTASVLEAARTVAALVRAGMRPKRTLVFASWDAEEWGSTGSTEYAEEDSLRLAGGGVAYLNQDPAAYGRALSATASPSLRAVIRDVARLVPDPGGAGSVYDAWRGDSAAPAPEIAAPGGGSDFSPFYNHYGIPIADWSFNGPEGVYHSAFDSYAWMSKFGDPGFRYHAASARLGAALMLRLANADVLPLDYVEYARAMRAHLPAIDSALSARRWVATSVELAATVDRMERAAVAFAAARDRALLGPPLPRAVRAATNAALRDVERAFLRPEGLRTRPWYRNLIYAADENDGYATMALPSINEAIRAGDAALTARELADLSARFANAARALDAARRAVGRVR